MRRAIVVVALSFSAGVALAALAIQVNRAGFDKFIVRGPPSRERIAATSQTSIRKLARQSPPKVSPRSNPAEASAIGDDSRFLPGWAPGSDTVELQLIGMNYEWVIRYPDPLGADGSSDERRLHAGISREIHLPANTDLRFHLESRDFVYLLTVPNPDGVPGRRSQIAVPHHLFTLDFNTGSARTLVLRGDHLCGLPRTSLDLTVIVQSHQEFQAWLADQGM